MEFEADDRIMALATAYRALTIALFEGGALKPDLFEEQATRGAAWLEGIGAVDASNAMAEMVEPIIVDLRLRGHGKRG